MLRPHPPLARQLGVGYSRTRWGRSGNEVCAGAQAQWTDGGPCVSKMAAAMDVDTPSGTNSGAGKKRFEVKKVGSRQRLPQGS